MIADLLALLRDDWLFGALGILAVLTAATLIATMFYAGQDCRIVVKASPRDLWPDGAAAEWMAWDRMADANGLTCEICNGTATYSCPVCAPPIAIHTHENDFKRLLELGYLRPPREAEMSATVIPIRQLPNVALTRSLAEVESAIREASTVADAFAYYEALRPMSDDVCKLTTLALRRADDLLREEDR